MLKNYYDLSNANELRDELISYLKYFDKEANQYQTDLYLYVDMETNTGSFYEFTNVGGRSWLNDDHYTLYKDEPHYQTWEDMWCDCTKEEWDEYIDDDIDNYYQEKADEIIYDFNNELRYRAEMKKEYEEYQEYRGY